MNKKIAIPTRGGILSAHFGHCEKFAIYNVTDNKITKEEFVTPPPHEPGSHPAFLRELGCTSIIAGGMGSRAQQLFAQNNIEVIIGLSSDNLKGLVETYISEGLTSRKNLCDH
ncbi:MAG: ATPase [Candidatus Cloacimonetes bacterium]|jgi:predicted Fe-Mo cluster-binding NifX family protein|nr:ATPase [Candidatus Cloacimonadota bacterium]MBT4575054.1 ATPase [Candidatus Cloacimonadota bacterium]